MSLREFALECRKTIEPSVEDAERIDAWPRAVCYLCLTAVLHCLEPGARLILLLRVVARLEYREIARIMKMNGAAVRQSCSRSTRKLNRFGTSECALMNPGGACRCGQRKWIMRSELVAEFAKLRSTVNRMQVFLDAETVFPDG